MRGIMAARTKPLKVLEPIEASATTSIKKFDIPVAKSGVKLVDPANMDELVRVIDALQFHEEHGEVCPAQWEKGKKGMTASADGVAKYLSENAASL